MTLIELKQELLALRDTQRSIEMLSIRMERLSRLISLNTVQRSKYVTTLTSLYQDMDKLISDYMSKYNKWYKLIKRLPLVECSVCICQYIEGHSIAETALIMHYSDSAISKITKSAKLKLLEMANNE